MERSTIQIELIRLSTGERLLRLSDPKSGLSLERALDPNLPVHSQKERLFDVLEAALRQVEAQAA
jgi:hypothetical protein